MVDRNKLHIFVPTRNTNTKNNTMKNLQAILDELQAAHTSANRDANDVARLFTMANNMGAGLKAFNFITNKPVKAVWNAQKANR